MDKVLLIDYYGTCDIMGNPIGHSPKVLKEYAELLKGQYEVAAAVSPCLVKEANQELECVIPLKFNLCAETCYSLWERIKDKFKLIYNIHMVMKIENYDILWFYRTDFFLFLYFFCKITNSKTKIIGQVYQAEYSKGIISYFLNFIIKNGAKKFNGLIYTQKGMKKFHKNMLFIPDYYYDENKYGMYKIIKKKEKVICLGTMNPYKKLEELVKVFNKNGVTLEIRGYFYDKKRFNELNRIRKNNIFIEDAILTESDYYKLLGESKYSILPYDMNEYRARTSGILQECAFLNVIPIAPQELLDQNEIKGLGYESIYDLIDFNTFKLNVSLKNTEVIKEYDKNRIKKNLIDFMKYIKN